MHKLKCKLNRNQISHMYKTYFNRAKCNSAVSVEQQRESNFVKLVLATGSETKLSMFFGPETYRVQRVEV